MFLTRQSEFVGEFLLKWEAGFISRLISIIILVVDNVIIIIIISTQWCVLGVDSNEKQKFKAD